MAHICIALQEFFPVCIVAGMATAISPLLCMLKQAAALLLPGLSM
jgi:hypothetical protein